MVQIKQIVASRFLYFKVRNKDWYKKRRQICANCELSSHNKQNKTLLDSLWMILNLSRKVCTVCGCGTKYKATYKENECSLGEQGEKPKWISIWTQ